MNTPAYDLQPPESGREEATFMATWKTAIKLSGHPKWFGVSDDLALDRARNKDALRPRVPDINKGLSALPASQACLIAAMVGFYNPAEGARMAAKLDANGIGDLARPMNPAQRIAVGMLLVNFQGW